MVQVWSTLQHVVTDASQQMQESQHPLYTSVWSIYDIAPTLVRVGCSGTFADQGPIRLSPSCSAPPQASATSNACSVDTTRAHHISRISCLVACGAARLGAICRASAPPVATAWTARAPSRCNGSARNSSEMTQLPGMPPCSYSASYRSIVPALVLPRRSKPPLSVSRRPS